MTTYPIAFSRDCWEWQGPRNHHGYGELRSRRTGRERAHRVVYEQVYGPIPEGQLVLHKCDNPPCVRPDHLFLGTQADNMRDMTVKGRRAPTPKNVYGRRKLNQEEVGAIRTLYRTRSATQRELADAFGISQSQVSNIVRGWQWREPTA